MGDKSEMPRGKATSAEKAAGRVCLSKETPENTSIPTHPPIQPPIHPSIYPSTHSSIHPSIHPSTHSSIFLVSTWAASSERKMFQCCSDKKSNYLHVATYNKGFPGGSVKNLPAMQETWV